ncbi:MAG: CoA pyrophosphatase [Rhodospirillales bacterium]|nr:CoA pyrophosphatase [Rhodospirillales bacterium]
MDRFAARGSVPGFMPLTDTGEVTRGDHTLNPGLQPSTPLKSAAVLVPLVDYESGMSVLFTKRTAHLARHAGQVSFPGGRIEAGDGGPVETALRETEEEIGLAPADVEVIGHLDTYVTRTGFVVTPVVGIVQPPCTLTPDPYEVAEIFEVPLAFLLDPVNHRRCSREFEGVTRHFYAMQYGGHFIWGATAGMLIDLYEVLTTPEAATVSDRSPAPAAEGKDRRDSLERRSWDR